MYRRQQDNRLGVAFRYFGVAGFFCFPCLLYWRQPGGGRWLWQNAPVVRRVQVDGRLQHLSAATLKPLLQPLLGQSMFDLQAQPVRVALLNLPWVKQVWIRKQWPGHLLVSVKERQPVAYWRQGLLSASGVYFQPDKNSMQNLPLAILRGPDGSSARVLQQYSLWQLWFTKLHWRIASMQLATDGLWHITLRSGTSIVLQQLHANKVVARLLRAWPAIMQSKAKAAVSIDLRYPHGMAVRWEN